MNGFALTKPEMKSDLRQSKTDYLKGIKHELHTARIIRRFGTAFLSG